MFKVVFYKKPNGDEPAIRHLNMLLPRMRAKVLRNMSLLQERGNLLRYPETDDLGDGIFELRTSLGGDMERTLFFYAEHRVIVITHGFIKKTRKTPRQEIERAKQYRADYYAQRKAENDNS